MNASSTSFISSGLNSTRASANTCNQSGLNFSMDNDADDNVKKTVLMYQYEDDEEASDNFVRAK